jgi:NAD(P)-dependent dehydrogenase (short-subunit alcohol dehydrogenase family)
VYSFLAIIRYPTASTLALKCDVSSAASVSSMIESAVEKFGRIDLAVNNGI